MLQRLVPCADWRVLGEGERVLNEGCDWPTAGAGGQQLPQSAAADAGPVAAHRVGAQTEPAGHPVRLQRLAGLRS